jgi:acid phosphatase
MPLTRRAFVRTLFVASQTALAARLLTDPLRAEEPFAAALNFAVIGDWGRLGRPDQAQVAKQMALACDQAKARFVISVGDNFYEDGVASVDDPQWQKSFENVYAEPSLQVPWYVVLGNHDYHGNCDAQLDYAQTHPRWIMPARYYLQSFPLEGAMRADFFYLDTSPMILAYQTDPKLKAILTQDVPRQIAWLEHSLAASTAPWKIVVGHHPIYSAGTGHGNQPELIASLLPILQKHKVQVYFSGHDHDLEHLKADGVDLFISGGGSENRPVQPIPQSEFRQASSGFAMVSLRPEEMRVRIIDNLGNQLYRATVPRMG